MGQSHQVFLSIMKWPIAKHSLMIAGERLQEASKSAMCKIVNTSAKMARCCVLITSESSQCDIEGVDFTGRVV